MTTSLTPLVVFSLLGGTFRKFRRRWVFTVYSTYIVKMIFGKEVTRAGKGVTRSGEGVMIAGKVCNNMNHMDKIL